MTEHIDNLESAKKYLQSKNNHVQERYLISTVRSIYVRYIGIQVVVSLVASAVMWNPFVFMLFLPNILINGLRARALIKNIKKTDRAIADGSFFETATARDIIEYANSSIDAHNQSEAEGLLR